MPNNFIDQTQFFLSCIHGAVELHSVHFTLNKPMSDIMCQFVIQFKHLHYVLYLVWSCNMHIVSCESPSDRSSSCHWQLHVQSEVLRVLHLCVIFSHSLEHHDGRLEQTGVESDFFSNWRFPAAKHKHPVLIYSPAWLCFLLNTTFFLFYASTINRLKLSKFKNTINVSKKSLLL